MSWTKPDDKLREQSPHGRFEIMCERYMNGSEDDRRIILSLFNEDERRLFLQSCGLYHLFRDQKLYKCVCSAIGAQIYEEAHRKVET